MARDARLDHPERRFDIADTDRPVKVDKAQDTQSRLVIERADRSQKIFQDHTPHKEIDPDIVP